MRFPIANKKSNQLGSSLPSFSIDGGGTPSKKVELRKKRGQLSTLIVVLVCTIMIVAIFMVSSVISVPSSNMLFFSNILFDPHRHENKPSMHTIDDERSKSSDDNNKTTGLDVNVDSIMITRRPTLLLKGGNSGLSSMNEEIKLLNQNLKHLNALVLSRIADIQASIAEAEAETETATKVSNTIASEYAHVQSKPTRPKIAIFFNTYQPPNQTEIADKIIQDQLIQINEQPLLNDAVLYYFANNNAADSAMKVFPKELCHNKETRTCLSIPLPKLSLALPKRGSKDFEQETLHYLFHYCESHPEHLAMYINSNQQPFTDSVMKAVISDECLHMNTKLSGEQMNGSVCNTCSAQFHGLPNAYYPGNMWVANCEYIKMLIPPREYQKKKKIVLKQIKDSTKPIQGTTRFETKMGNGFNFSYDFKESWMLDSPSMFGIGSMDQWLGSHPYLKPCDVYSPIDGVPIFRDGTIAFTTYRTGNGNMNTSAFSNVDLTPKLQKAPGMDFEEFWTSTAKNVTLHPWFEEEGTKMKSRMLYSVEPDTLGWFPSFWNDKMK
jgi:hypothetical protein